MKTPNLFRCMSVLATLLCCLCLTSCNLFGEEDDDDEDDYYEEPVSITASNLVGTWESIKVEYKDSEYPYFEEMTSAYKSTFTFSANGSYTAVEKALDAESGWETHSRHGRYKIADGNHLMMTFPMDNGAESPFVWSHTIDYLSENSMIITARDFTTDQSSDPEWAMTFVLQRTSN